MLSKIIPHADPSGRSKFGTLSRTVLAMCVLAISSSMVLNGCKSTIDEVATKTHGSKAGDGFTYGTGPNKTKPYPQTEPVNITNVGGATPKYEPYSRGGNKDYTVLGQNYMVWNEYNSYQEVGTASWYGPGFHGNKTSNGEVYDQKGFSAAHKNLPLPSYVKVTNLENGRAVIVRVNDRGPFHGTRIIDLSEGAARAIDMTRKGTAKVKLELIDVRNGKGNIAETTVSGQRPIIGVINSVIKNNTSSATRENLKDLNDFAGAVQSGQNPDIKTTVAAAGAAIYFADKLLDSADSSSNNSNNSTTITKTVTTTTTVGDGSGEVIKDTTLSNSNYEVSYAYTMIADIPRGVPYVQVFSSYSRVKAHDIQAKVKARTSNPVIVVADNGVFRVWVGPVQERDLSATLEQMKQIGYTDAFIKRVNK